MPNFSVLSDDGHPLGRGHVEEDVVDGLRVFEDLLKWDENLENNYLILGFAVLFFIKTLVARCLEYKKIVANIELLP